MQMLHALDLRFSHNVFRTRFFVTHQVREIFFFIKYVWEEGNVCVEVPSAHPKFQMLTKESELFETEL